MSLEKKHTYLLRPGLWTIAGVYYDQNGRTHLQKGQIAVTHEADLWTIDSQLTLTLDQTQTVNSRYDVQPLGPEATYTEWKSETGGPEPVFGLFVLVDDTVMSPWQSRSGTYWGQEILVMVNPVEYRGRGFAFLKNEKVSAWSTKLTFEG